MPSDSYIVKRSLFISFIGRYANTALQFVSIMVLARLLTPEDIGIYTVGLAIIGIAHMIRDFGIGKYLVQEKNLTREIVAAALGLTIVVAWSLGTVVMLTAPAVAQFYEEDAVRQVIYVVALNFFIIPFGAMAPALLKRSMSFGTLLKINLGSTFVSVLVGIALAFQGFGYMSMAWASVANVGASAVLAQYYLPRKYRVFPTLIGSRKILGFGGHIVGANLAKELNASALDLLVGKFLGFASLGFLSRAQGYVKIYNNVIQKAVNPVVAAQLAKIHRSGDVLDSSYSNAIDYITVIGWFCLGFMALMSDSLIDILYGDQWASAASLASLLCLVTCISLPNTLGRSLLVSTGRVKTNFYLTLGFMVLRVLLIVLLVESGLRLLLSSFIALSLVNFAITHALVFSMYGFSSSQIFATLLRNLFISLTSLAVPIYLWLSPETLALPVLVEVVLVGGASCISWLAVVYAVRHPINEEISGLVAHAAKRAGALVR